MNSSSRRLSVPRAVEKLAKGFREPLSQEKVTLRVKGGVDAHPNSRAHVWIPSLLVSLLLLVACAGRPPATAPTVSVTTYALPGATPTVRAESAPTNLVDPSEVHPTHSPPYELVFDPALAETYHGLKYEQLQIPVSVNVPLEELKTLPRQVPIYRISIDDNHFNNAIDAIFSATHLDSTRAGDITSSQNEAVSARLNYSAGFLELRAILSVGDEGGTHPPDVVGLQQSRDRLWQHLESWGLTNTLMVSEAECCKNFGTEFGCAPLPESQPEEAQCDFYLHRLVPHTTEGYKVWPFSTLIPYFESYPFIASLTIPEWERTDDLYTVLSFNEALDGALKGTVPWTLHHGIMGFSPNSVEVNHVEIIYVFPDYNHEFLVPAYLASGTVPLSDEGAAPVQMVILALQPSALQGTPSLEAGPGAQDGSVASLEESSLDELLDTLPVVPPPVAAALVTEGTPVPQPERPIDASTVTQVVPLAQWGKGAITGPLLWSPDGGLLTVPTTVGTYLYEQGERNPPVLLPTTHPVLISVFTGDGKLVAMGTEGGIVQVWQASDGRLLHTLPSLQGRVYNLTVTSDDALLAAANQDAIILWNLEEGRLVHVLNVGDGQPYDLAFSASGELLAVALHDGTIQLWQVAQGNLRATLPKVSENSNSATAVAFSRDDTVLTGLYNSGLIAAWDVVSTQLLYSGGDITNWVSSSRFSDDGTLLVLGKTDGMIQLWRSSDGLFSTTVQEGLRPLTIERQVSIRQVVLSHDQQRLAAGANSGEVTVWNVGDGSLQHSLPGHDTPIVGLSFSQDGNMLASASEDGLLQVWRVFDGTLLYKLEGHFPSAYSLAFSPDGSALAVGSEYDAVLLRRTRDGIVERLFKGHEDGATEVAFSPDGQLLATLSYWGVVRLWRVEDARLLQVADTDTDYESIAWSPTGELLAMGTDDGAVQLWNVREWKVDSTHFPHQSRVLSLDYSLDGTTLVSVGDGGPAVSFSASSGEILNVFSGEGGFPLEIEISSSGELVALSTYGAVNLWYLRNGNSLQTLPHGYGIAFSVTSDLLAVGTSEGVQLSRVVDGTLLASLQGHTGGGVRVSFSPDGRLLATTSADGTVRVWGVQ
jgi:WD40 repeat protein